MRHNIIVIQVLERVYNVAFPALYLQIQSRECDII
jgi:hypothetical protein